jgi:hypothetical protein
MASSRLRTALALSVTLAFLLGVSFDTSAARGGGRSSAYSHRFLSAASSHRSALSSSRSSIKRDPNAKSEFKRANPNPPAVRNAK